MSWNRSGARYTSAFGHGVALPVTRPLCRMTCGSRIALVRPWATWKVLPRVCAMAWTRPRKALANAMPATVDALCIRSRASGSSAPRTTHRSRLSKISLMAWRHSPSV